MFLRKFVELGGLDIKSETRTQVEDGLVAYAADGRLPKLIAFVRGFGSHPSDSLAPMNVTIGPTVQRPCKLRQHKVHAQHISQQLYKTLCRYSRCTCVTKSGTLGSQIERRHLSRLRLKPPPAVRDKDLVCYDLLFSSRPASSLGQIDWQQAQFRYPK